MHTPVNPFIIFKSEVVLRSGLQVSQIDHDMVDSDYELVRSNGGQADEMQIKLSADMQIMLHNARSQKRVELPNARSIATKWTVVA